MQVMQFLIKYKSFEHDLTYLSVRHCTEKDQRIYNHMSSEDWWWNIQDHLNENDTVISLLLASDKIMLTQHHEDKTVWSIYLIIKNLSNKYYKIILKSALILIEFILLVFNKKDRNLKNKLYYQVLIIIMKYRCFFIFLSLNICWLV